LPRARHGRRLGGRAAAAARWAGTALRGATRCPRASVQKAQGGPIVATVTGNELLARSLRAHGVEAMFFLCGGPIIGITSL